MIECHKGGRSLRFPHQGLEWPITGALDDEGRSNMLWKWIGVVKQHRTNRQLETIAVRDVQLTLGILGKVTMVADRAAMESAWEIYVELATRISTQDLRHEEGLLREALSSLHSIFDEVRKILRAHGPSSAKTTKRDSWSVAQLAIWMLNYAVRPYLAKWHPLLSAHESALPEGRSPKDHERSWDRHQEARTELDALRQELLVFSDAIAELCGVTPIHKSASAIERPE